MHTFVPQALMTIMPYCQCTYGRKNFRDFRRLPLQTEVKEVHSCEFTRTIYARAEMSDSQKLSVFCAILSPRFDPRAITERSHELRSYFATVADQVGFSETQKHRFSDAVNGPPAAGRTASLQGAYQRGSLWRQRIPIPNAAGFGDVLGRWTYGNLGVHGDAPVPRTPRRHLGGSGRRRRR